MMKIRGIDMLRKSLLVIILAAFFVVEASLIEFVRFSSAWFGVRSEG